LIACGHDDRTSTVQTAPAAIAGTSVIPSTASQLITVIVPSWSSVAGELRLWQREPSGWRLLKGPWPAVIGNAGTGWGAGLHGPSAPADRGGPTKIEGDAKSPAGAFAIGSAFGYATKPPRTALSYQAVDEHWHCVDDPRSRHYNQIVNDRTTSADWTSAEVMRGSHPFYAWVIELAHNPARVPDAGSCIFLHVWGGPASTTLGCTAIEEPRLVELLAALQPDAVFVLLPREDYEALAPLWRLPR
jgi:L,D-peptidoglycan transpeptidase YkuD (ErfK/YbiS/YcfS/YnhG family)